MFSSRTRLSPDYLTQAHPLNAYVIFSKVFSQVLVLGTLNKVKSKKIIRKITKMIKMLAPKQLLVKEEKVDTNYETLVLGKSNLLHI